MSLSSVTAFNLKEGFEQNRFCTTEIIRYIFRRIKSLNAKVNAYTTLFEDEALLNAEKLDYSYTDAGKSGSLQGIPLAISSNLLEKDSKSTSFNDNLLNHLKKEGAIILGATSRPANNPWNTSKTAGYTSGGAAAAVAAGMASLAVSLDSSSNIIEAAAFCGVLGLKVSLDTNLDHYNLEDSKPKDNIGLFARNVRDCALLLNALTSSMQISYVDIYNFAHKGYRIAIIENLLNRCYDEQIKNSIELSVSILKELGFSVDRIHLDNSQILNSEDRISLTKELFQEYQIVLAPSTQDLPYASQHMSVEKESEVNIFEGYPLLSLPCGFSSDDLPIGLQLASDKGNELVLLQVAAALEKKLSLSIL